MGLLALTAIAALAEKVAVITPFLAQPGTQAHVNAFEAEAQGCQVNVIDTAGDVAAVIARMEDSVTQHVNAIGVNVDPPQNGAGLQAAADAKIPVIGRDAGADPLIATNITSNG